jgi:hypothetical protein
MSRYRSGTPYPTLYSLGGKVTVQILIGLHRSFLACLSLGTKLAIPYSKLFPSSICLVACPPCLLLCPSLVGTHLRHLQPTLAVVGSCWVVWYLGFILPTLGFIQIRYKYIKNSSCIFLHQCIINVV